MMTRLTVTAHYLGERLDTRALSDVQAQGWSPLVLPVRDGAWAVLFRFGAVVLAGLDASGEEAYLETLKPHVVRPHDSVEVERLPVRVDPERDEVLDKAGTLWLREVDAHRLQVVAEILAKSAALAHYETEVCGVFNDLEPLVAGVRQRRARAGKKEVLTHLGHALNTQARIMGRVEVAEKPEITWDDPQLDRLYERLATEFELAERNQVLTRKIDFISRSADLLIGMAQHRQSLRVEWYIVILIVIEILLLLFELFTR